MSSAWPAHGRRWSAEELSADAAAAVAEFRGRRLGEPLKRYLDAFEASKQDNAALITRLQDVLSVEGADSDFSIRDGSRGSASNGRQRGPSCRRPCWRPRR